LPPPSLYAGLQVILPGNSAHAPTRAERLRMIVEGEGAYTAVEGDG
jgi:gentisate 1,2-dioxygenase